MSSSAAASGSTAPSKPRALTASLKKSSEMALSIPNGPARVRRSAVTWPTVPSARAISRAKLAVHIQEHSLGARKATFPALNPELSLGNSGVGKATIRLFECSKH